MSVKSKRIGLIGFDQNTAKTFKENGLNIVAHIYANETRKKKAHKTDKSSMNFHSWKSYHFTKEYTDDVSIETLNNVRENVFEEFIRCTDRWPWSSELVSNWNDYNHLFKLACIQSKGWLEEHKIECLIYNNIPHQGMALAQYALAQTLGIKTLIFTQSSFPGRSFLIESWKDIGIFKTSKETASFTIDISEPSKPPFYMSSIKSKTTHKFQNALKKLRARSIVTLGLTGFSEETRHKSFHRNTRRWQNTIDNSNYIKTASQFFQDKPIKEEYIYLPLHLQPEMTTDVLGGEYADQVLTLERLRQIIPENIAIYVKENPKQTGQLRSGSFFKRIEKIPNLKFISPLTSSFDLIKNASAVATISGTAGWEALRMKKAVIVFGNIFWNHFPGAFHITENPQWSAIKAFKFDEEKLQNAADQISKYAHEGISDLLYAAQVENFDEKENRIKLIEAINLHLKS